MKAQAFHAEPAARQRVADLVFESLAKAILNGTFKPNEPLTTQRDLAQQFGVSALVVRQAIHRLEDLGLVRVRQGSTTIVLDPAESSDIRLIQLQMEFEEPGPKLAYAVVENRMLFLLPMLILAERRITEPQIASLRHIARSLREATAVQETQKLRAQFWIEVARATDNPLFQQQVRWFAKLVAKLSQRGLEARAPRLSRQGDFYERLVERLSTHSGVVSFYLESIGPCSIGPMRARRSRRKADADYLRRRNRFTSSVSTTLTTKLVTIGTYSVPCLRRTTISPGSRPRPRRSPSIKTTPTTASSAPSAISERPN